MLKKITILFMMIVFSMQVHSADYVPATGDTQLDNALIKLSKDGRYKKKLFIKNVSNEFQIPRDKIEELFEHYKFNIADVLMTISIADATGQPMNNISRSHFENKQQGWQFTLNALDISTGNQEFQRIKKDIEKGYISYNK